MKLVSRGAWGAKPPKDPPTKLNLGNARGMAVHYEGVDRTDLPHDRCDDVVRGIQRFHQVDRGWDDIAYSFLVCRHGYIYEGRGWGVRTAANGTDAANAEFHAVCYLDDDQAGIRDVTPAGLSALSDVVNTCRTRGWGAEAKPHSDFKPTPCPGAELRAWIKDQGWLKPSPEEECHTSSRPRKGPTSPAEAAKPRPGTPSTPSWYKRLLKVQTPMIKGNDVVNVQRRLKLREDGLYGPATESKVRGFQKLHGLTPDGVVGPKTATKLAEVYG